MHSIQASIRILVSVMRVLVSGLRVTVFFPFRLIPLVWALVNRVA
jgi:hypothetical protein